MKPESKDSDVIATMRDVTVTFDGYQTRAVSRVDLEIRRGEILGVLGPKGAGKSTILKILAGRMRATEGKVKVFGRSPGSIKSRIGFLPQTGDSVGVQGLLGKIFGGKSVAVQAPSAGSRLTQAILGNRDLLVLDEALSELSAEEKVEAVALIRELIDRGKTVVLSSDSLNDIKELCHRLAVIDEGRIQAIGTLNELLQTVRAIRFLPAVLPRSSVERVLTLLRKEILGQSVSPIAPVCSDAKASQEKSITAAEGDEKSEAASDGDLIDYKKLEGLTRPTKSR